MNQEVVILLAEDDEGHANLIRKNLKRAGIINQFIHFRDGQEAMDFLLRQGDGPHRTHGEAYVLLLDIRMPRLDGIGVLELIKTNPELKKIPVIILTTTDDPREVDHCHALGCNNYITKPVEYDAFIHAIRQLGLFLSVIQIPMIQGDE